MKIDEFENIIIRASYDFMMKEGIKCYENGLVKKVKGKKFEEFYSLYGEVENEIPRGMFNTYIKINLHKKCIDKVECNCRTFKSLSQDSKIFMCSHLTATAYKFLMEVKKTTKLNTSKEKKDKSFLKLIRKATSNSLHYELRAYLGSDKTIINPEKLRETLDGIANKNLKFTYDYLEVISPIIKQDLPITFTVKERDGQLVVTSHKKLPISLTPNNDVYFFDNELYLPSKKQVENYLPIYKELKNKGELVYPMNIENYNKITSKLSSISTNITIRENVKSFAAGFSRVEFFLYKEQDKVYCKVNMFYANKKIDILADNADWSIRYRVKEELLLIKVCSNNFIRREEILEFIGDDEALFKLLKDENEGLHALGRVVLGEGLRNTIYTSNSITSNLYEEDGDFKLSYHIEDFEYKELYSAYEAFKANKRFYKSKNGFLDFEDDGVRNLFNLIDGLNFKENIEEGIISIDKNKGMYLSEVAKTLPNLSGVESLEDIEKVMQAEICIPSDFHGTLRNYQVEGFKWLKRLSKLGLGGILADEMGLGKTIEAITFILSEKGKNFIIIAPTSLIYNWKSEFEKFAKSLKVGVAHGSNRTQILEHIDDYDVILTTYGTLKSDKEIYESITFDYCIIDEAQNIKNPMAENAKMVKNINSNINFALTGTPMENNLMELWSIFDFILPGYLYSKEEFKIKFSTSDYDVRTLKSLILPFILRRTKKEVVKELPDKIEKQLIIDMTREQSNIYKAYVKSIKEKIAKEGKDKIEVFSYLTKLRQICLDPSLIIEDYNCGSGKVNVALKLIEEAPGKVLLFSQFTSVLDKLGEILKEKNINYFHIDGKTPSKARIERVDKFNSSKGKHVFLISLKAGGTGLNLTSATTVIHFDPWWNPAVEDQATDRAHRIGQKNVVEVIKLIAKGTIEEKIILLQEDKKRLIDNIITGELNEGSLMNKLSKEEILKLMI